MSGGADSTFAALHLKEEGYSVTGATYPVGRHGTEEASAVAARMGIPHKIVDIRREFDEAIKLPFIRSYEKGKTPNPCVMCNRYIKFGLLFRRLMDGSFDYYATGHHVRTGIFQGFPVLRKGVDVSKDQSYFLSLIDPAVIPRLLFPCGSLEKGEIRRFVSEKGFEQVAGKRESYDICFVPRGDYRAFLGQYGVSEREGFFVDEAGTPIAPHEGITRYTIGQRKGLRIALGERTFVRRIDSATGTVELGEKPLMRSLSASSFRFFVPWGLVRSLDSIGIKIRYKSRTFSGRIDALGDHAAGNDGTMLRAAPKKVAIHFDEPADASSPGQIVALYYGDILLGGGIIESIDLY